MLLTMAVALAASTTCTDVKRVCRACPVDGEITRCSTIGIACQPSIRVCRSRREPAGKGKQKPMTSRDGLPGVRDR